MDAAGGSGRTGAGERDGGDGMYSGGVAAGSIVGIVVDLSGGGSERTSAGTRDGGDGMDSGATLPLG